MISTGFGEATTRRYRDQHLLSECNPVLSVALLLVGKERTDRLGRVEECRIVSVTST